MGRFLGLLAVLGIFAAVPLSHVALAKPAAKVDICHVNSANDIIDFGNGDFVAFGRVISVSENAVDAHEAHGDSADFIEVDATLRDLVADLFGINLPNANCAFAVDN